MRITIRPATPVDADRVTEILLESRRAFLAFAPSPYSDEDVRAWVRNVLLTTEAVTVAVADEERCPDVLYALASRDAAPADFVSIDAVNRMAFEQSPHGLHNEHAIVRALRASGNLTISLVAELEGRVVGHIALSPVSISDGTPHWFGLGPVAVHPDLQGQGIGQWLVREALQRLEASGGAGCVLLGEPGYYARFGFKPDARLVLPGVPPEYFQALHFMGPAPQGVVTYHEAFNTQA